MKNNATSILIAICLIFALSVTARAGLSIDSVYPNVGKIGEDLDVDIRGSGFDANTRVSMVLDTGNRLQIVGSMPVGYAKSVDVIDQTAYVVDPYAGLLIVDVGDPQNPSILGSVDIPRYPEDVTVVGQIAYVAAEAAGLQLIDVRDPQNPTIIGAVDTPGSAFEVDVAGETAYVADGFALRLIDVKDPYNPRNVNSVILPNTTGQGLAVADGTAYVTDLNGGLHIIDVSDRQNPSIISSVGDSADGVYLVGQIAYVACGSYGGLQVIDVSDSQNPKIIGKVDTPGGARKVTVIDQTAYVADYGSGLQIIDVSDPRNPAIIGSVDTPGNAFEVDVIGQTAYVADRTAGLQIIDVSNPQALPNIGSLVAADFVTGVVLTDQIAYVTNYEAGLLVVDVSNPQSPTVIGSIDTPGFAVEVAIVDHTAYVADDYEGLQIIDVRDPKNPVTIGSVDTPEYAEDVAVTGQTAYVVDSEAGLVIIDVTDPQHPMIAGSMDIPEFASDVFVVGQTAYVAAGDFVNDESSLQVIDVSDPKNPVVLGWVSTLDWAYDITLIEQTAYLVSWEGLEIIDVSDPGNPVVLGRVNTYDAAYGITVIDQIAYLAGGDAGVLVIDVSDPRNPAIIGSVDTGVIAGDVAIKNDAAFVAGSIILNIVPVPREIIPVQVAGSTELQVTLSSPSIAGNYNLRVFDQSKSDELVGAVTFFESDEYQDQKEKKAIIAAGGSGDPSDRLTVPTRTCANYAYLSLLSQGYSRENIRFLASHIEMDVDGDGFANDVDDTCASATLSSAIAEWGADASELIVYLVDHGGDGTFFANAGEIIRVSDLDGWLDNAQSAIPGKAMLIYDACYSGSFLPHMVPPAGKERIVIASSQADERAWFMKDGTLSFSYQFWASVFVNANLYESFVTAKNMMAHDQTGVLDADGDGAQTKEDVELARDFLIGRGRVAASTPPSIGAISDEQFLSATSQSSFWVSNISSLNEIESVWAVIVPPDFASTADTEVTGLDTVELKDPDGDGVYVGSYDRFEQPGTYRVTVHAKDEKGQISLPRILEVNVETGDEEGPATLYFPFTRSDGFWETEIGVVNKSTSSAIQGTFVACDQYGTSVGTPKEVNLQPMERTALVVGSNFSSPDQI